MDRARGIVVLLHLAVLVPVLCFLASGPMLWLAVKGYLPYDMYNAIYSPLHSLYDVCLPARPVIEWWNELWFEPFDPIDVEWAPAE